MNLGSIARKQRKAPLAGRFGSVVVEARKSGVRPSFFGFVPLMNTFGDHADRGVAQPDECTDFLQCIIVPPLCGCWRSVE